MFNSMKSQFREKTGKELPKFTPQKGGLSRQSRQGSESSLSSLVLEPTAPLQGPSHSPATLPVQTQDVVHVRLSDGKVLSSKEVNILAKKEEEWRHRIEKKEAEWSKKLEKREAELMQENAKKEEEWKKREQSLLEDLLKQTNELKDALRTAEDYKKKICQYQEDKDQLEGFQTQEMAKIKHLLLAKEKESAETAAALKESIALVENLKAEVSRLRPLEEKISNYEDKDKSTISDLTRKLRDAEENISNLTASTKRLEEELRTEKNQHSQIKDELVALKQKFEGDLQENKKILDSTKEDLRDYKSKFESLSKEAVELRKNEKKAFEEVEQLQSKLELMSRESNEIHKKLEEVQKEAEREKAWKEDALLRNAQVSQEVDIAKSELKQQASEHEELFKKLSLLETSVLEKDQEIKKNKEDYAQLLSEMSALQMEAETRQAAVVEEEGLKEKIASLEQQVADRNKNIRVLQQKLSDMKKTLQKELKSSDLSGSDHQMINNHSAGFCHGNQFNSNHPGHYSGQGPYGDDEVNFLYLKHVIMKFLTSREYEVAQHLTRAVATLLKLSPEEECLLKDTLDWKMSWFGTKPRLQDYSHS